MGATGALRASVPTHHYLPVQLQSTEALLLQSDGQDSAARHRRHVSLDSGVGFLGFRDFRV